MTSFLSTTKLNKAQKEAVTHTDGPLLLVAGAGTGKTTVLINRLAYLLIDKKINSEEVLLLTFTEKAAGEMEERADRILPYGYVDLWINTFHGFGERVLREHALELGLDPAFKLLNETDQWVLIKKNLDFFKLDYYAPLGNPSKFISELLKHFSRLKDENISVDDYKKYVAKLVKKRNKKKDLKAKKSKSLELDSLDAEEEIELKRLEELAFAYEVYNKLLLENSYLDFGDLIIYTIKLFLIRPNILKIYRNKFKYIMVDEFQDTNLAQYELIKILAAPLNNLLVTGDDDQAVYKFRGASISNIMQFKEDYAQAKEIVLIENYRSRQEILDTAYKFIKHNNPNRLEAKLKINKKLQAKNDSITSSSEASVKYLNFPSQEEELSFVASEIEKIYIEKNKNKEEIAWLDFAILLRANNTADAYLNELNRRNIPNQFMSWRGLYYKPIILDILNYLRLLDNYHDSSALFRVLNMEVFKVSHIDMININKKARTKVWSLFEALKNIDNILSISEKSISSIKKLLKLLELHEGLTGDNKTSKIFLHFAYDSGLLNNLDRDRDLEQFSYLNQFYQKIKKMEDSVPDLNLRDFLEAINLELEAGETGSLKLDFADNDTVKIMTVHGAKGLEFKYVFIVNLVDKKFPTISRSEKISIPEAMLKEKIEISKNAHMEEERRLFYVALTRAKKRAYLSSAKDYGGVREKKASVFISEAGLKESSHSLKTGTDNDFLKDLDNNFGKKEKPVFSKEENKYPLPSKFSFSQLAAFSTCPLQYKFAFVLKVPVPGDKAAFIFGRSLHNTLYHFLLPLLNDEKHKQLELFTEDDKRELKNYLSLNRLKTIYSQDFIKDGYLSKEVRGKYFIKGEESLDKFFKDYKVNQPYRLVFLEKRFSFKIGSDIIKGTIDRVDRLADGSLEIIDYKTGSSKKALTYQEKRQLILYQLFLEEYLQERVTKLSYYYLEDGTKLSFEASLKDKEKLKEQILAEIKAIYRRDFSPKPSPLCKFCDFNSICEFKQR